jgi:UDP-N-acetylmuramate: L-alanyl-gamma-D-glutamyl-meso-diaminopimelate ligase
MHNLAIALHKIGYEVSGSDDEINDPSRSRLASHNLLPTSMGWDPARIHAELDAVILGMHAKKDNPELLQAQKIGVKVYSYPEFIVEHSSHKHRVAICGSHGKTTITSMVMHVLQSLNRDFDYLVGAQLEGFDTMVKLSKGAPLLIVEGDEYLASPIDRRPKFLVYQPHVALLSGVAWDHINVFPTEAEYIHQFELLVDKLPKAANLIYNDEDKIVRKIVKRFARPDEQYLHPYTTPSFSVNNGVYEVKIKTERGEVGLIGKHNMANIAGAWEVCRYLAVELPDFLKYMATFKGAARRMEKIYEDSNNVVFRDFAHSPSKVQATVEAVKDTFGRKNIIACLELHTFSSLNKQFLSQYKKTLKTMKNKIVFINEHTLKMKNYPPISRDELVDAFQDKGIVYVTKIEDLASQIRAMRKSSDNVVLMMSSGNFAGQDLQKLALGGV